MVNNFSDKQEFIIFTMIVLSMVFLCIIVTPALYYAILKGDIIIILVTGYILFTFISMWYYSITTLVELHKMKRREKKKNE